MPTAGERPALGPTTEYWRDVEFATRCSMTIEATTGHVRSVLNIGFLTATPPLPWAGRAPLPVGRPGPIPLHDLDKRWYTATGPEVRTLDDVSLASPLVLGLLWLGALAVAAIVWVLPIPYREKRIAVGSLLVLAGLVPISCGFCGMCLVGFAWQSIVILGVVVAVGLASIWLGGRMLAAARRYSEEPAEAQMDAPAEGPPDLED